MRRPGLKSIWAVLLAAVLLLGAGLPVHARPGFFNRDTGSAAKPLPSSAPSGKLQEVAPPGAVQQLRQNLQQHRPSLRLIDPSNDSIVTTDALELSFEIEDWPLSSDPELGLGPHVVLQIDNRAPLRLSESNGNRLKVRIDDLEAGSHRFSAWAAYPWGEAVQAPGASVQGRLHLWQKLQGTQPERDAPWLVPVSPAGEQGLQPLLVDWLIWRDKVWVHGAVERAGTADAISGETILGSYAQNNSVVYDYWDMFWGIIPGSVGETSKLLIILGALFLIFTKIGSWRIIFSTIIGALVMGLIFNGVVDAGWISSSSKFFGLMSVPFWQHLIIGSILFGAVFMATDPVTAAQTNKGKWIYGFLIGFISIMIRVFNPAYPEGVFLAILLMNVFAPTIDHYVVQGNVKKRMKRLKVKTA